jgi:hypothetical protein
LVLSSKLIGIVTGAIIVLASIINFYGLHNPENGAIGYFNYALYTVAIIAACYLHKQTGSTSIKSFFNEGFKCFIIMVLFIALYTFIFYKLHPEIINAKMLEINAANAAMDKDKTPAEILKNGENFKSIFIPMTVGMTVVFHLVIGAIVSLVAAAFLSQTNNKS